MAGNNSIKLFRGTEEKRLASNDILAHGQPFYETDTNKLYIGDGVKKLCECNYVFKELFEKIVSQMLVTKVVSSSITTSTSGVQQGGSIGYIYIGTKKSPSLKTAGVLKQVQVTQR